MKLGELCEFQYGKALKESLRVSTGGIPVYGSSGVTGWHDKAYVASEGIVVGRKGSAGKVSRAYGPFWPIDTTFYITPSPAKYDLDYLYYYLQSLGLEALGADSAVPGLNRNVAYCLEVSVPPVSRQKEIGAAIRLMDERMGSSHKEIAALLDLGRGIFDQEMATKLSGSGRVLTHYLDFKFGQSPPGSAIHRNEIKGVPFYQGAAEFGELFPTVKAYTTQSKRTAKAGSVLLSVRAPAGTMNLAPHDCSIGRGVASVWHKSWMFAWFTLKLFEDEFAALNKAGTVFGAINRDYLNKLQLAAVDDVDVESFATNVMHIEEKIVIANARIAEIEKMKQAMLHEFFS